MALASSERFQQASQAISAFEVADVPLDLRVDAEPDFAQHRLELLAEELVSLLGDRNLTVATAESLTGGLVSAMLTSVSGSSSVVMGGVVSYATKVKNEVLGVAQATLDSEGPVCASCAAQMAKGVRNLLSAELSVSCTGIAGPSGAEPGKPVGTVYIGACSNTGEERVKRYCFPGDRETVRLLTVVAAFCAMYDLAR